MADLDGDGKSDLIWRNTQSGDVAEWLMNGAALKSWSTIEPGSQWANKPFAPILADHMEVSQFKVDLTAVTIDHAPVTLEPTTIYEYLPKLRLTETGGAMESPFQCVFRRMAAVFSCHLVSGESRQVVRRRSLTTNSEV